MIADTNLRIAFERWWAVDGRFYDAGHGVDQVNKEYKELAELAFQKGVELGAGRVNSEE